MIRFHFFKVFKWLITAFFFLLFMHIVVNALYFSGIENPMFINVWELFDFNQEENIPTLYSVIILLISAAFPAAIARRSETAGKKRLWLGMAAIFLFIGIDEFTTIHENVTRYIMPDAQFTGFLQFSWVVPFSVIILVVVAIYAGHIFSLPKKTRNRILLAGAVFVGGGFFIEMVGGKIDSIYGKDNLLYAATYTIEESAEMIGILIFIQALAGYYLGQFTRAFRGKPERALEAEHQ